MIPETCCPAGQQEAPALQHSLSPYDRLRRQQLQCTEEILGYAVCIASEKTVRTAYLTGGPTGERLTNDERAAAILPKEEAVLLMTSLYESGDWFDRGLWNHAFLVPVSRQLPLWDCTFQGY